jgi:hypothetical protein
MAMKLGVLNWGVRRRRACGLAKKGIAAMRARVAGVQKADDEGGLGLL